MHGLSNESLGQVEESE